MFCSRYISARSELTMQFLFYEDNVRRLLNSKGSFSRGDIVRKIFFNFSMLTRRCT